MYNYPYGNSQQLNLDWLITAWRTFQGQIEDMLAPAYSDSSTYSSGDLVIYNHILYQASEDITTAEEFDSSKWTQVTFTELLEGGG